MNAIAAHPVVILAGETGSGKTTQVPKMCLAAGRGTRGRIGCTQPRRVAALSLSRRVAEEVGVTWGREVGCKVRFSDETTRETVVKFLTDGMLLAEAQGDPLLSEYDTIVVDEAHERSLNIDFLLGHLRQLRFRRPDLKLIITSATIDTEAFSAAFDGAPVIVVEGRMYPVEVIYAPLDALGSDALEGEERRAEAMHYVDGAVDSAERIAGSAGTGDILVFMPSERDIRETCELLSGRLKGWDVVSLYGRLTNEEQRRVFSTGQRRRIVVATNIAETSLTIPGIRYVVDTGLVRMSRYSPQARTRRLPIEPVSQSSADQRKGRCGRIGDGVCIRLYSEEDYLARPRFTQPEIQRANLADVILRLRAGGFGDVERFPFISPPATKAVRAGYALLEELGALAPGAGHELTPLGSELARLPVDPTVARMILQARAEKAVEEVLVIASGLSIQDPRERPQEKRAQADAAHRRFAHPDSDYLTLLKIWDAYHTDVESMSQGRLRAFCRSHHLSYMRMREWRDVHSQLLDVIRGDERRLSSVFDGVRPGADRSAAFGSPAYRAIHRSILAGLLGNIAKLDEEDGGYRAAHDRHVALFPGSVLSRRGSEAPERRRQKESEPRKPTKVPRWIMAAEIAETSRLFARTCARLDPAWVLDLGAHVVSRSHSEPFWSAESGKVLVKQRTRLYGLEIETRSVGFGAIDSRAATAIFIREGLVNDTITWPFDFLAHNRKVRENVEAALTRARHGAHQGVDEALYAFYAARLTEVSSVAELVDLVRERRHGEKRFLMAEVSDLMGPAVPEADTQAFPAALPLDNRAIPLNYVYRPGKDDDGATLTVNVRDARSLTQAQVDWAVPGHLAEKVEHFLRALPKEERKRFMPLPEHARRMTESLSKGSRSGEMRKTVPEMLTEHVREAYGAWIDPSLWHGKPLPDHLRVRVRIVDDEDREIAAGRDLGAVLAALESREKKGAAALTREEPGVWLEARRKWEVRPEKSWVFGTVPGRVIVAERAGVTTYGYPGLEAGAAGVALRLFHEEDKARAASRAGLDSLLATELRHDLGWVHRDLKAVASLGALLATLKPAEELQDDALHCIRDWACGRAVQPMDETTFKATAARAREELRGIVPRFTDLLKEILTLRQELLVAKNPYPSLAKEIEDLIPPGFVSLTPYVQLQHFPRYLKAKKTRVIKRRENLQRDADRQREVDPFAAEAARVGGAFRWLAEEFRVSLFAQELGTVVPVSRVKLEQALESPSAVELGSTATLSSKSPAAESPPPKPPPAEKRGPALKSLAALKRPLY